MKNFNYFYTGILSLPISQFEIYYDFNESGANPIVPQSSSQPQYLGTIGTVGSFYSIPGSGRFSSSQHVSIANASGLSASSFTMFFVYEKPYSGNAVLFSSLTSGGSVPSGFIIGINDANRLYFECYDQNGQNIYTSSNIYGEKNAIAVSKQNNLLNFYYYNFNEQAVEPELFTISSTALYQSNQATLGSPLNAPAYVTENSFSGYMDQFVYVNSSLTSNIVSNLFSGFYASGLPYTVVVVGQTNGLITGASISLASVGTAITGFHVYLSGYVFDNDGNALPVYLYNNQTGTIIEDTFVPLIGGVTFQISGLVSNGFYLDTGYCLAFGMDGVNLLRPIQTSDYALEFYAYNTIGVDSLGLSTKFNSNGNFFMSQVNNQVNLYVNGIAYNSGTSFTGGSVFIPMVFLSGNYYLTGNQIVIDPLVQPSDNVTIDIISGTPQLFSLTTTGGQSFTSAINTNLIYLNGQKLISGSDYTFAGSTLTVNTTAATGLLISFPMLAGFTYTSGRFISKFGRDTSMLWLNGQRQTVNEDYIEISNVDLLNNTGIFGEYNNSWQAGQFIEEW